MSLIRRSLIGQGNSADIDWYEQVEFIKFNGAECIDVGLGVSTDDIIELSIKMNANGDNYIFGTYDSKSNRIGVNMYSYDYYFLLNSHFDVAGRTYDKVSVKYQSAKFYINNALSRDYSGDEINIEHTLIIGARHNADGTISVYAKMNCYEVNLQLGTTILHLIPVRLKRMPDSRYISNTTKSMNAATDGYIYGMVDITNPKHPMYYGNSNTTGAFTIE